MASINSGVGGAILFLEGLALEGLLENNLTCEAGLGAPFTGLLLLGVALLDFRGLFRGVTLAEEEGGRFRGLSESLSSY